VVCDVQNPGRNPDGLTVEDAKAKEVAVRKRTKELR
jgi:hypothetical protein